MPTDGVGWGNVQVQETSAGAGANAQLCTVKEVMQAIQVHSASSEEKEAPLSNGGKHIWSTN